MKKHIRILTLVLCIAFITVILGGCAKENKYVNLGVYNSTDSLSLYLTGVANSFIKVSTYVYFSDDIDMTMDKLTREKQCIHIAYMDRDDIYNVLNKDNNLKVVFIDSFNPDGSVKGVWVASKKWLFETPTYSKRFIENLVSCVDYRKDNMNMTYEQARNSIVGVKDFDFEKYTDVMQYCAIFAQSNPVNGQAQPLKDDQFVVYDVSTMYSMFEGFKDKEGAGYELCNSLYQKYAKDMADPVSFYNAFDMDMMIDAFTGYIESGNAK